MKRTMMKLLLLSMVGVMGIGTHNATAAVTANPLDTTVKLGVTNDKGQNWVLKNAGGYKMKWSMKDVNPYQHYELYAGPEGLVYVQTTDELLAIAPATGKQVWKQATLWDSEQQPITGIDGAFYKLAYAKTNGTIYVTGAERFNADGTVSSYTPDTHLAADAVGVKGQFRIRAAGDSKGNLVLVTDQGLVSLRADGGTNWVLDKVKTADGELSLSAANDVFADGNGQLYVRVGGTIAAFNLAGELLWARDYELADTRNTYEVSKDGYLIQYTASNSTGSYPVKLYEMSEKGLQSVIQTPAVASQIPLQDGKGGIYKLNETQRMITDAQFSTGATKWTYQLTAWERNAGHSLSTASLVSDAKGNLYFGSNVGTVYSLDAMGKPRFTLTVNNAQLSYADILPVNDSLVLISVNNRIVAIEKKA